MSKCISPCARTPSPQLVYTFRKVVVFIYPFDSILLLMERYACDLFVTYGLHVLRHTRGSQLASQQHLRVEPFQRIVLAKYRSVHPVPIFPDYLLSVYAMQLVLTLLHARAIRAIFG
jgi:hypothetical protein